MKHARLRRLCRHGTLTQLAVFEAVARHESITRAAEEMCLAQPTVSLQMKKLAECVGVPLLEPAPRGLRLTAAGREVYTACEDIFGRLMEMQDRVAKLQSPPNAVLRIAACPGAKYMMPRLLGAFWQTNPEVKIAFDVVSRAQLISRLHAGEDSFYVFSDPPEDIDAVLHTLTPDALYIYARSDHPFATRRRIPLREIADQPFLMPPPGSSTRLAADRMFSERRIEPRVCMELETNEAIKQGVLEGLGLSLLSRQALCQAAEHPALVALDVEGLPLRRHWYLAHATGRQLTPPERAFVEHALRWSREAGASSSESRAKL